MTLLLALLSPAAHATDYVGTDWGGADLVLADGDVLEGTFTNVGRLEVPAAATVRVRRGVPLRVSAELVVVDGQLDASGAGFGGGASDEIGDDGRGPGAGSGSSWGTGGGGAGFGGDGGGAADYCSFGPCSGIGASGGRAHSPELASMGSGGGGGSSHYDASLGLGGAGGGGVMLVADEVRVDGSIVALGATGGCADHSSVFDGGGGGGGSGGLIRVRTALVSGSGDLSVRGGDSCGLSGGGGGGGWVIIEGTGTTGSVAVTLDGGLGSYDGAVGRAIFDQDLDRLSDAREVQLGTDPLVADTDGDGLRDGEEVRKGLDPLAADTDADGVADGDDDCPLDPSNDADGDGVCGEVDNCPFDRNAAQRDGDGDGIGTVCDLCFGDNASGDTDGDGDCDDLDNCPLDANPRQGDADGDGLGNVCDPCFGDEATGDVDGDGVCSDLDACPRIADPDQLDRDADGVGDACDTCPTVANPAQRARFFDVEEAMGGDLGATWVDIAVGDIDGDGRPDVVGANEDRAWYHLNGEHARIVVTRAGIQAVALGDIDGDDVLEILRGGPNRVAWYVWNGWWAGIDWDFLMPAVSFRNDVVDLAVLDIDGDGLRDVMVLDAAAGELVWHAHLGGGVYGAEQLLDSGLAGPGALGEGDVDDDGDADVVLAHTDADEVLWYERLGGSLSSSQVACEVDAPGDVSVADLDGDDLGDVVAMGGDGDLWWCRALPGGGFGVAQAIGRSEGSLQVATGDLDGDGDHDVVTGGHWFENVGGAFGPPQELLAGSPVVDLADMDGDGDLDVLAAEDRDLYWLANEAPCE